MAKFKKGDVIASLNLIGKINFMWLIVDMDKKYYKTILLLSHIGYSSQFKFTSGNISSLYINKVDKYYELYDEAKHGKI